MPEKPPTFRDFGILPDGLQPPPEKIRCFFSPGRIVCQYIAIGIIAALGLGLAVLSALTMPLPMSLLACAAALTGFGAFVYLATHNDYRWVELDGDTLRAKHLYTGCTIERSVEEIESLGTMFYQVVSVETAITQSLLGRVRGVEIRFRDRRTPLQILRSDPAMTNAKELIEAILYRMSRVRELDAEVVTFRGRPLVRNIHWKGDEASVPPGKNLKLFLGNLIGMALMLGTSFGYSILREQERHRVGSVPPHEITLRELIQNGPGTNRHVTVTDFSPGGYANESESGPWTGVWIALFPAGVQPDDRKEIKVVLSSNAVRDQVALGRFLQPGRVTGICSEAPGSKWGRVLEHDLVQANHGCPLSSAWSIEELRESPSEAEVTRLLTGAGGCFVGIILLAMIVFWKAG